MSNTPPRMIPDPDGRNADFYRHLATGQLHIQHCATCGSVHHPPRFSCPSCGGEELIFRPSSGEGRIFSWTVTHRPVDPGWAARLPYAIVVVEMKEGVRLVGAWAGELETLALDQPVQAEVEQVDDHFAFLWFRGEGSEAKEK